MSYSANTDKTLSKAIPTLNENGFIGEDINLCRKLKELGFDIWVNTKHTCSHIGSKVWMGDFSQFIEFIQSQNK